MWTKSALYIKANPLFCIDNFPPILWPVLDRILVIVKSLISEPGDSNIAYMLAHITVSHNTFMSQKGGVKSRTKFLTKSDNFTNFFSC